MLSGKKVLVTAGPTYEPIDPVRFIGNRSSGKMGYCIAESLALRNADVILISGPTSLKTKNPKILRKDVRTSDEMYEQCISYFPVCDIAIMAAAVSDFKPLEYQKLKIKKFPAGEYFALKLAKTTDILENLGRMKSDQQILVGFSLETDNEIGNATVKISKKNLDFIVLNSLADEGAGFGSDTNKITIITKDQEIIPYALKSKSEVAQDILDYIEKILSRRK